MTAPTVKLTYAQQLAHPMWQRRRLEMLSAANWACQICASTDQQLHVHHRQYFKGRMAWEYTDIELAVLCIHCHQKEHFDDERMKKLLTAIPLDSCEDAFLLLMGFFCSRVPALETIFMPMASNPMLPVIGYIANVMRELPSMDLSPVHDVVLEKIEQHQTRIQANPTGL